MLFEEIAKKFIVIVIVEVFPLEIQQTFGDHIPISVIVILSIARLLSSQMGKIAQVIAGEIAAAMRREGCD